MNRLIYRLGCVLLVLCLVPRAIVGQDGDDCLTRLRAIYRKQMASGDPENISHMIYSTTTTSMMGGKPVTSDSEVDLLISERRMRMKTPVMEVYQDDRIAVTLLPGRRLIYIADSDPKKLAEQRARIQEGLQDTILSHCRVESCTEAKGDEGAVLTRVVLRPPEQMVGLFGLGTVTVTLNEREERVTRVEADYGPDRPLLRVDMTFRTVEHAYATSEFDGEILERFLDDSGKPRGAYAGFGVQDVRVRK